MNKLFKKYTRKEPIISAIEITKENCMEVHHIITEAFPECCCEVYPQEEEAILIFKPSPKNIFCTYVHLGDFVYLDEQQNFQYLTRRDFLSKFNKINE